MAEYLVKWPSGREPISKIGPSDGCGRMEFLWRWTSGTISTNLDVIWGMSVKPGDDAKQFWSDLKGVEEANTPWIAQTQIDHLLSRYDDKLDLEG